MSSYQEKTVKKILSVLEKGYLSENNYNSLRVPFFQQNKEKKFSIDFQEFENHTPIPEGLNRNIKLIYRILGNPNKEIYLNEWTILSYKDAFEQYKDYCNKGQKNIFNIAYRYLGMGHVEVLSCDLITHLLFYRKDGGSNGYDREINYNDIIKNGANNYKKFYFSNWFYNIKFENNNF